jgi:uncharacterized damage-inducible protein DinB
LMAENFGLMYQTAAANLDGMNREHALAQPRPGGNSANWIVGHLTNMQNGLMRLLGEKPVWESDQLERARFDPIAGPADAIEWDTLKQRFLDSRERCLSAISALSDDALLEPVPHPFGGMCTRAELLNLLAFHQAYHAGQLALSRRIAGLEGAVKGPGQSS